MKFKHGLRIQQCLLFETSKISSRHFNSINVKGKVFYEKVLIPSNDHKYNFFIYNDASGTK